MKALLPLIFFFFVLTANSQNTGKTKPANTPGKSLSNSTTIQNMVQSMDHDTCLDKKFSVVFYLINDSNFTYNASTLPTVITTDLTPVINLLNATFKRICVSFENCSTVVIPDYNYNKWDLVAENVVTNIWFTENTINIYVPKVITYSPCQSDYAYLPSAGSPTLHQNFIVTQGAGPLLLHAMGHFFGLPHTFAEINPTLTTLASPSPTNSSIVSREFVDRSNCYLHGDGFCDTEADPEFNGTFNKKHIYCDYNGLSVDGKGQYYIPPVDNYMSFYDKCMCLYSQEQYNFMARTILQKRMYLH
ncbi:MAG: hypothetical protein IT236_14385 [Bacteroidia bacterium]|nr:hypothetical protein [Bacteroidia bacterium]